MIRPRSTLVPALLALLVLPANPAGAQPDAIDYQYRFGGEKIPAATADEPLAPAFSSQSARDYLERGATLWARQKKCVSCHTHGIYAAVRPALTPWWGRPSPELRAFLVNEAREIRERGRTTGSTPAQLAYIARGLAAWDARYADATSTETDSALRHLLTLQAEDGSIRTKESWPPLNSGTWHATVMAAIAAADAPGWLAGLADDPPLRAKAERLTAWLRDTPPRNDHHRLLLLWAATRVPGLVNDAGKEKLIETLWNQQRPDGGWSTRTFATRETWGGGKGAEELVAEPDYQDPASDGYQTGLAVVVLRDAGVPASDPRLKTAVAWLLSNQRSSGRWWTRSLNTASRFHYVSYSGTAYAALALARCGAMDVVPSTQNPDDK